MYIPRFNVSSDSSYLLFNWPSRRQAAAATLTPNVQKVLTNGHKRAARTNWTETTGQRPVRPDIVALRSTSNDVRPKKIAPKRRFDAFSRKWRSTVMRTAMWTASIWPQSTRPDQRPATPIGFSSPSFGMIFNSATVSVVS